MALLIESATYRRWFLIILVTGFALRAIWALLVPVHPVSDSTVYDQLAWSIADRGAYAWPNGQPTAYWPVGTAFIYSIPYRLFGHAFAPIVVLNLSVATVSLALLITMAQRWFSSVAALAAGTIYALWPSQIEFTSVLASELLFTFFLLLSLWVAVASPFGLWIKKGLSAGLFLACASYIRPTALPLVVLVAIAFSWNGKVPLHAIVRFTFVTAVGMAVCIAPWTIRNIRELGSPVLISTNGPANTWMGNNPQATGSYMPLPNDVSGMNEVDRSQILGQKVRHFVTSNPARAASLFLRKLIITHERETIGISWNEPALKQALGTRNLLVAKAASTAYWWLALILGLTGGCIVLAERGWRGLFQPALFAWGYFALVHAATVGADRYHFPSIPFIAMLGGLAVSEGIRFGGTTKLNDIPETRKSS